LDFDKNILLGLQPYKNTGFAKMLAIWAKNYQKTYQKVLFA